jgi:peptidoglycan/LPS O-acetylase OafA/YrhL
MKTGTSRYLDQVRFSAALIVFREHLREHTRNSFGAFWRSHPFLYLHLGHYGKTAVMVFFVLSGYVNAHVQATHGRTPLDYPASRLARLCSLALPALILTVACNYFVEMKNPSAFTLQAPLNGNKFSVLLSRKGPWVIGRLRTDLD